MSAKTATDQLECLFEHRIAPVSILAVLLNLLNDAAGRRDFNSQSMSVFDRLTGNKEDDKEKSWSQDMVDDIDDCFSLTWEQVKSIRVHFELLISV